LKLSVSLALIAGATTFVVLIFRNLIVFWYQLSFSGVLGISTIILIVTFCVSALGIKLQKKKNYTRGKASSIGAVFGLIAYLLSVVVATIAIIHPDYYERALEQILIPGFILGGFLGPLTGAYIGYKLSSTQ